MRKQRMLPRRKTGVKKRYAMLIGCALGALVLASLASPPVFEYAKHQIAAVLGIEAHEIYDFQKYHGITRNLKMGDSGTNVVLVQRALEALRPDFPAENITGYYGEKTQRAVFAYQQEEGLPPTGSVDAATRENLNSIYMKELCPPGNPGRYEDEILIKVNRTTGLPKDYIPSNLIDVSNYIKTTQLICLKAEVATHIRVMMSDAAAQKVHLAVTSGLRRSDVQGVLFNVWKFFEGDKAGESVALPYHSEHQLGAAVDLSGKTIKYRSADHRFANTVEYQWLVRNAYKYGFAMSYPAGKQSITGYTYEPWHWRFVGLEAAKEIYEKKISVEEYFNSHDWLNPKEEPEQEEKPKKSNKKKVEA